MRCLLTGDGREEARRRWPFNDIIKAYTAPGTIVIKFTFEGHEDAAACYDKELWLVIVFN